MPECTFSGAVVGAEFASAGEGVDFASAMSRPGTWYPDAARELLFGSSEEAEPSGSWYIRNFGLLTSKLATTSSFV